MIRDAFYDWRDRHRRIDEYELLQATRRHPAGKGRRR